MHASRQNLKFKDGKLAAISLTNLSEETCDCSKEQQASDTQRGLRIEPHLGGVLPPDTVLSASRLDTSNYSIQNTMQAILHYSSYS